MIKKDTKSQVGNSKNKKKLFMYVVYGNQVITINKVGTTVQFLRNKIIIK